MQWCPAMIVTRIFVLDFLENGSEDFAIDKFPDSFDGWCLIYVKGPNGEQLEFNQVRSICKENFKEAQQQYNRLNGTDYSWPQG